MPDIWGALLNHAWDCFSVSISEQLLQNFDVKMIFWQPPFPLFQMIHEGNNAVLLIANTYEEDTGTFTCRATTSAGQVERTAKLIVKSKK